MAIGLWQETSKLFFQPPNPSTPQPLNFLYLYLMRFADIIIKVMGLLAVGMILSLSLNAVLWADDFHIRISLGESGMLGFMLKQYHSWDGRFISLNAVVQLLLLQGPPALAAGAWSMMFLLSAALMLRIFYVETGLTWQPGAALLPLAGLFSLLWLGFSPLLAETLYWITGGIYTMSLAMSMAFIWMVIRSSDNPSRAAMLAGFLLSIFCGMAGVIVGFPLLVFLFLRMLPGHPKGRLSFLLLLALGLTAGILINLLAPGNYRRAAVLSTSFVWDMGQMALNFMKISYRYLSFSLPAIGAALLAAVLLPRGHYPAHSNPPSLSSAFGLRRLLEESRWFVVAFSGILPMLVIPDFAGGRTSIFFMAYLFLGIWITGSRLMLILRANPLFSFLLNTRLKQLGLLLLFICVTAISVVHFSTAASIRRQVVQREAILYQLAGTTDTVWVKPVLVDKVPFSVFFLDLKDADYAKYYGFSSIRTDSTGVHEWPDYYLSPRWGLAD